MCTACVHDHDGSRSWYTAAGIGRCSARAVSSAADCWDDAGAQDWPIHFFVKLLREHGARSVLDVATGTGFHSVRLLREGFEVVSVDGSPNMLARAFKNARERDLLMRTVHADWRFLNRDIHG